jgi:hypothetical protein
MILSGKGIIYGKDYNVTGRVTDLSGNSITNTRVTMQAGNTRYSVLTGFDGGLYIKDIRHLQ